MMEYTIAAYPTVYRGRRYRSRLEARWAAFFDLLNWRHEYEPFDIGGWSPDFLLHGGEPDNEWDLLVEVKPIKEFDADIWEKMVGACREKGLLKQTEDDECPFRGLLLAGISPVVGNPRTSARKRSVSIGWFDMEECEHGPSPAFLIWMAHYRSPKFFPDIMAIEPGGWFTASGDAAPHGPDDCFVPYGEYAMELWAQATNIVQWRPEGRT